MAREAPAAVVLAALLSFAPASPAGAGARDEADRLAGTPPGGVVGRAMTAEGKPVPGARVTLQDGEVARMAETDDSGEFCFCRVAPARGYTVRIEKEGFAGVVEKDVYVGKRKIAVLNVILRPLSSFGLSGEEARKE